MDLSPCGHHLAHQGKSFTQDLGVHFVTSKKVMAYDTVL